MSTTGVGPPLGAQGCLTADGLNALAAAPVGHAPPELALHIAGCARCQDRLLALSAGPRAGDRPARSAPWRNLVVITMALVLIIVVLGVALGVLTGG
jgi:hypothetical protein